MEIEAKGKMLVLYIYFFQQNDGLLRHAGFLRMPLSATTAIVCKVPLSPYYIIFIGLLGFRCMCFSLLHQRKRVTHRLGTRTLAKRKNWKALNAN